MSIAILRRKIMQQATQEPLYLILEKCAENPLIALVKMLFLLDVSSKPEKPYVMSKAECLQEEISLPEESYLTMLLKMYVLR